MYNEKIRSYIYKYNETHQEQVASYKRTYNAKRYNDMYANDPEFREKEKQRKNAERKERYATDAEYREMINAKRKALYQKKKLEKMNGVNAVIELHTPIEVLA